MALTPQQIKANKDYESGKITGDEYKKLYVTPSIVQNRMDSGIIGKPVTGTGTVINPNLLDIGTPQTPTVTPTTTTPTQSGIIYDESSKVWVDTATGKVVANPNPTPVTSNVADMLAKSRAEAEASALERQRLATDKAKLSLGSARDNALAKLTQQRTGVDPKYGEARKQAVVGSTIAQKRLADLIPFSGAMAGDQVRQGETINTDLQNRQSALDVQKAQELQDITTREQDVNREYETGLASAELGAMEQTSESLANITQDYANKSLDEIIRQEGITADQAAEKKSEATKQAETDKNDYIATIDRFGGDYQQEINNMKSQGVPDTDYRIMALQSARQQKLASIEKAKAEQEQLQLQEEKQEAKDTYEQAMAKWLKLGYATQDIADVIGVPVGTKTSDQSYKDAQTAIAQMNAKTAATKKATTTKKTSTVKPLW